MGKGVLEIERFRKIVPSYSICPHEVLSRIEFENINHLIVSQIVSSVRLGLLLFWTLLKSAKKELEHSILFRKCLNYSLISLVSEYAK